MSKQKKKPLRNDNQNGYVSKLILAKVLLDLIKSLIELINKLIE